MKSISIKYLIRVLFVGLLSLLMQSCGGNKDPEIQTAITSETQTNPDLAGVTATVVKGVVTLTGQCPNEDCRKKAEKAIKKIDGVKDVTNNIMITTAEEVTPDKELKENTEKIMSDYKGVQAVVSDGVITLRGQVKENKLQQLIMDLNALRPKRIDNQLVVK